MFAKFNRQSSRTRRSDSLTMMIGLWLSLFVIQLFSHPSLIMVKGELDLSGSGINVNELQSQLPADFPKTNISLQNIKDMLHEKCSKVVGEDRGTELLNELETGIMTLTECIGDIVNYTAIQGEIAEASPNGELDVVFNKYCAKKNDVLTCVETFNNKLTDCLDQEERESQSVFMRMIRKLLDFVCHKGGDQIALFIAEKGPECLQEHRDNIQQCLNTTLTPYLPAEGLDSVKTVPKLVLTQKQCGDIRNLETCIVNHLETCEEITPANIVESLFRFMKNETICRETSRTHRQVSNMVNGIYPVVSPQVWLILSLCLATIFSSLVCVRSILD